eukprot:4779098-Prymnesium_polylepis.3
MARMARGTNAAGAARAEERVAQRMARLSRADPHGARKRRLFTHGIGRFGFCSQGARARSLAAFGRGWPDRGRAGRRPRPRGAPGRHRRPCGRGRGHPRRCVVAVRRAAGQGLNRLLRSACAWRRASRSTEGCHRVLPSRAQSRRRGAMAQSAGLVAPHRPAA